MSNKLQTTLSIILILVGLFIITDTVLPEFTLTLIINHK